MKFWPFGLPVLPV